MNFCSAYSWDIREMRVWLRTASNAISLQWRWSETGVVIPRVLIMKRFSKKNIFFDQNKQKHKQSYILKYSFVKEEFNNSLLLGFN